MLREGGGSGSLSIVCFFFFQAEDGIRDVERSRGLGDVYKRQVSTQSTWGYIEMKGKDLQKRLHPDALYIEQDAVGKVICKGLAILYKEKPAKPVEYLAKWLLKYHSQNVLQKGITDNERNIQEACLRNQERLFKKVEENKKQEAVEAAVKKRQEDFENSMANTEDLFDLFQELAEYLKEMTKATGVYLSLIHI
eukprot:TRINITY_DN44517_c0_g1_i1.p2 TRINITY_DN44517_c0_g1~~TRINITY_DN44517_c0_g1_i1.p2  ORF type:complete len:194 (+),score=61.83 TRINITY_DN44517_c0_g1_i1:59-640(+)